MAASSWNPGEASVGERGDSVSYVHCVVPCSSRRKRRLTSAVRSSHRHRSRAVRVCGRVTRQIVGQLCPVACSGDSTLTGRMALEKEEIQLSS